MIDRNYRRWTLAVFVALVVFGTLAMKPAASISVTSIHFGLSKSAPAGDVSLESPAEIRLWFTEEPEEGTTSIRLIDAAEEVVQVGDLTQHPDDARSFAVSIDAVLPEGSYTVRWRGMGSDGHVVSDTFKFSVVVGTEHR